MKPTQRNHNLKHQVEDKGNSAEVRMMMFSWSEKYITAGKEFESLAWEYLNTHTKQSESDGIIWFYPLRGIL